MARRDNTVSRLFVLIIQCKAIAPLGALWLDARNQSGQTSHNQIEKRAGETLRAFLRSGGVPSAFTGFTAILRLKPRFRPNLP